jgi:hypothetical protein
VPDLPEPPDPPDPAPTPHAAALRRRALDFLATAPLGTRVVVRAHHGSGARDALGELVARTDPAAPDALRSCTVRTKREEVEILLADVVAAKPVPPPPAPRARRRAS